MTTWHRNIQHSSQNQQLHGAWSQFGSKRQITRKNRKDISRIVLNPGCRKNVIHYQSANENSDVGPERVQRQQGVLLAVSHA